MMMWLEQCLAAYCLYVMPMANKDGVARGRTRFNMNGKDLNRDWLATRRSSACSGKRGTRKWLEAMIERGQRPDLAIDFHNDASGKLHFRARRN
jgi:murein tripeptide amidase MpaA